MKKLLPLVLAVLLLTGCRKAVMTSGDFRLSATEFSYYYWSEFFYLKDAYGEYLDGVVDFSEPLDEAWETQLIDQSLDVAADTLALVFAAEEEGFTLPDDYAESLQDTWESFEAAADGDLTAYLQASYGKKATAESFRLYLEHAHLANAYADHLFESLDPTEAEIGAYLENHMGEYLDEGITEEAELHARAEEDLLHELHGEQVRALRARCDFQIDRNSISIVPPEGLYNSNERE